MTEQGAKTKAKMTPPQEVSNKLWNGVGKPKNADFKDWCRQASDLLKSEKLIDVLATLTFAVEVNEYSIEYLHAAKDPMASFIKNYDDLSRRRAAHDKAAAVREKKENGLKHEGKLPRLCPHPFHLAAWNCPVCLREAGLDPSDTAAGRKLYDSLHKPIGTNR